jgi:ribosomal protein S18 acetylase RimI-like enzyme
MKLASRIIPMTGAHCRACDDIVGVSEPWLTLSERVDFRTYITLKQAHVCTVLSAGKPEVAGFVIFTADPVFARGGYLRAIGVTPAMRRHGIGRKLLAFAESMIARRCDNIFLCVSSFNHPAQSFYRKLGYQRAGKMPDLLAPDISEYIYWKRLHPSSAGTRRT